MRHAVPKRHTGEVDSVVGEIETCLTELEQKPASPSLLYQTEQFIHEKLVERYEAMVSRYVRLRRKANVWRQNALTHLRQGRLFRCGYSLACRPWLAVIDTYLSFRFCIAAMRKEL
jgi:hypothetical protein